MYKLFGCTIKSGEINIDKILNFIQKLANENNLTIQLFDAKLIFGKKHLDSAIDHAIRAFKQNKTISDSLAIEILLYASGEYQIKNAIAKLGLNKNTKDIAILILKDENNIDQISDLIIEQITDEFVLVLDESVLVGDENNLIEFGITNDELSATPKLKWFELVLEKVALVDIKK